MQIKEIFKKNIARPINGVVKADELDESVVWQELEEYVMTRELDKHFRKFLSFYIESFDTPNNPAVTDRMGVWVSGFFGSGKSHFLKVLSYLLENKKIVNPDSHEEKKAVDFFSDKINDAMVLGDLKRITDTDTDIILFNIDSKANISDDRATILSVFWRVFNESQGFCSDSLHLAEIERYLSKKGKFKEFKEKFMDIYGSKWEDERDAYILIQDEIVEALSIVLKKSRQAANDWFEKSEKDFNFTIENFAKRVKEYLDSKSENHRIVFLVDEIGQFIGSDTHLMLNLQTIVEELGHLCRGRAWVIVTSQEDIDSVIGDVKSSKANDFSKIQGRFNARLSLSSSNTDEVIQVRLLEKDETARKELEDLFLKKGDILKNQLSFSYETAALKGYSTCADFINNYPFIPYHFQLLQKIFESIRKAGATGLHLSRGERSMLSAFQSAAMNVSSKRIGALVPLYEFFPCIESFLDTAVKRSIDQAKDNPKLDAPFDAPSDIFILETLFLIRYVDILKPNIDNLVTLCISEVDTDKIALKHSIEAALDRLEKQNLINCNGDLYFFLTNEEREVSREIKSVKILSSAEIELLGEIIFDDVLKKKTKHRYSEYKRDYYFNRICDGRPKGNQIENELTLEIISPLHDEYSMFIPAKCNMYSAGRDGYLIVKLPDDPALVSEIGTFLKTAKYIKEKSNAAASAGLKTILRERSEQNRERRTRLAILLETLIVDGEFYTMGKLIEIKVRTSSKAIENGFDYLIQNTFSKFNLLSKIYDDPIKEIRQTLLCDDIARQQMLFEFENQEPRDIKEIRSYIDLRLLQNPPVILNELIRHFAKRPYGWGEFQTIIVTVRLFMSGIISFVMDSSKLLSKDAVVPLSKTNQWKKIKIIKRKIQSGKEIKKAQSLARELFGSIPPDGQDKLSQYIYDCLSEWDKILKEFKLLADTGRYPGKKEIYACLNTINKILVIHDPYELIKAFNADNEDLKDADDDLNELKDFYTNQRHIWDTLQGAMNKFEPNSYALEKNSDAVKALQRMEQILNAANPYTMLKEVPGLINSVQSVNDALIKEQWDIAVNEVDEKIECISVLLNEKNAKDDLKNQLLTPLQTIKKKIQAEFRIPHINYGIKEAQNIYEAQLEEIDEIFFQTDFETEGKDETEDKDGKNEKDDKNWKNENNGKDEINEENQGIKKSKKFLKPKKQVKIIKPADLKQKALFDTEDDVENYIQKLKSKLIEAIRNNNRIRIV